MGNGQRIFLCVLCLMHPGLRNEPRTASKADTLKILKSGTYGKE